MIRDRETPNILLDNVGRFVRERLVPNEEHVAQTDEIRADTVSDMNAGIYEGRTQIQQIVIARNMLRDARGSPLPCKAVP